MADPADISTLRRLISQPDDVVPWDSASMGARIDGFTGSLESLAATIWREKAASAATLVDMKEGNSSRSLSQIQEQALLMAKTLEESSGSTPGSRPTRTRRIERQ